jgi:hypothetical protein
MAIQLNFFHSWEVFPDGFSGAQEEEAAGEEMVCQVLDDTGAGDLVEVDEDIAAEDEIEGRKVRRDEAEIEGKKVDGGEEIAANGSAAGDGGEVSLEEGGIVETAREFVLGKASCGGLGENGTGDVGGSDGGWGLKLHFRGEDGEAVGFLAGTGGGGPEGERASGVE